MDTPPQPRFGTLLRRYRLAANLSQEALARHAGLSREAISALERGARRAPHPETVRLLSDALALDAAQHAAFTTAAHGHEPAHQPAPTAQGLPAGLTAPGGRDSEDWPATLVRAKVRVPRARPKLVERSRLRAAFAREAGSGLTLVSAPAGFGKTTLLGEWSAARSADGGAVAWLSLDGADNDAARFLTYLVGALRSVEEGVGEGILAALHSPEFPSVEAVVGSLVNDLSGVSREIALILDDYHLIDSTTVHGAVSLLIERLPDNVQLVVSSRTDPPFPLARLRARGQLTELRAADLRFTPEEAATFLADVMGLALRASDVAALAGITEGWVAALQLAALSLRDRDDIPGFVRSFSGSNRHVLDFLAEEVFGGLDERVRSFLLETAVLERMTAPLCDALAGRADGQAMLERLERENLFVVALDDERGWYRYHHLFADFLRRRLERERPGRSPELHLHASGWYEGNGLLAEAIAHALSAPDHERAARLIERAVPDAFRRGEFPTVLRWLEALPDEAERRRPHLYIVQAVALTLTGHPDDVEPLLRQVQPPPGATEERRRFLLGYAASVRSWRARRRGDAAAAVELGRHALALLPAEYLSQRSFAAFGLADALRATGDLAAADEALAAAIAIGIAGDHAYGTLSSMVWRARVRMERGHLRDAEEAFRGALRFVEERRVELLPAAGLAHIGMGALLYERNELAGAERALRRGIALVERAGEVGPLVWGYVTLSRTERARGNGEGALQLAREAERVARDAGADPEIAIAANWLVRLRLSRGESPQAIALEYDRLATAAAPDVSRAADRLSSARLLHARGRRGAALRLLEESERAAQAAGRAGELIEVLALRALVLRTASEQERAVGTLARALALAEPEGYVRTFLDEGAAVGDLLSEVLTARRRTDLAAADGVSTGYLAKLLDAAAQSTAPSPDARLPEPLSERELGVLALIAAGKSNREIAAVLVVSEGTVKTHAKHAFRKLGAHSRTQALAQARELGLL